MRVPPPLPTTAFTVLLPVLVVLVSGAAASGDAPHVVQEGAELAEALGCGACHAGLPGGPGLAAAPPLGPGAPGLPAEFVFTWLQDPTPRRPEIAPARMPDFRLSEEERVALALYLGEGSGGDALTGARDRHPDASADDGALLFRTLGCAGCHVGPATAPLDGVGPGLGDAGRVYREGWVRAFLSDPVRVRPAGHRVGTSSRMPDFGLTPEEASSLTAFLMQLDASPGWSAAARSAGAPSPPDPGSPPSPWARYRAERFLVDRLSCLGCHSWRGEGGRVGPPLDGVGARLTPGAISAAVHAPNALRPGTVMPSSPFRPGILDEVVTLLVTDTVSWAGAEAPAIPWAERRALAAAWAAGDGGAAPSTEARYRRWCAACHGSTGDGRGFNQPHLPVTPTVHADPTAMALRPDDTLHDGIAAGGWVLDRSPRMPAFGGSLPPGEVESLVAYIRELCDCAGPEWARGGEGG